MSQVSVSDGTITVNVSEYASLELRQSYQSAGGSIIHRMLDGSAKKQTHWSGNKRKITITSAGWVPSGLWLIDYSVALTITLRDPEDSSPDGDGVIYSVYADPPKEDWDINQAKMSWVLECEEI